MKLLHVLTRWQKVVTDQQQKATDNLAQLRTVRQTLEMITVSPDTSKP